MLTPVLFYNEFTDHSSIFVCLTHTVEYLKAHAITYDCYFSVSNTFLWGNTCRPGQRTTQTVQWGHFIKTLWHHDSALVSTSPTKIFTTTRPFPFLLGALKIQPAIVVIWGVWKYPIKTTPRISDDKAVLFSLSLLHQNCRFFPMSGWWCVFSSILGIIYYFWTYKKVPHMLCFWLIFVLHTFVVINIVL